MSEKETDQLLVERVQRGDRRAFDLLVLKYQRKLIRLLGRFVYDQAELEDIAQESFIKAYRALPNFRGESAFYTWLYRIAINTAKNHLASSGRRLQVRSSSGDEDEEGLDEIANAPDFNTPEEQLQSKQIGTTVDAAMEALPADLRQAIVLRELEGMSYEDIAIAMDCPVGTVRSRIFRAREAIATKLRPLLGTTNEKRW